MPRLSVLIPAHNAARTLPRAVASVRKGLPPDSEIVIANDGSTDTTGVIAEGLAHRYPQVRVIHNTESQGVAGVLNTLLQHTDSELIARMDADDVSLPGRLRFQIRALAQADAVFTPMVTYGSSLTNWRPQRMSYLPNEAIALLLTLTNPLGHPTLLTHRSFLEKVGGYREVPAEDYDLWMRMGLAGARLARIALPGYAYQQHSGQVTANRSWRIASWENQDVAATFAEYTEMVLGEPMQRLTAAAISTWSDAAAFESYLAKFTTLVAEQLSQVPPRYHRYIGNVMTRRMNHARTIYYQMN